MLYAFGSLSVYILQILLILSSFLGACQELVIDMYESSKLTARENRSEKECFTIDSCFLSQAGEPSERHGPYAKGDKAHNEITQDLSRTKRSKDRLLNWL